MSQTLEHFVVEERPPAAFITSTALKPSTLSQQG